MLLRCCLIHISIIILRLFLKQFTIFVSTSRPRSMYFVCMARPKTRKSRKSQKSRNFFSEIFKSEFSILAVGKKHKIQNSEIRRLGITFPRFPRFPTSRSFRFATFSFSFLIFFPFS